MKLFILSSLLCFNTLILSANATETTITPYHLSDIVYVWSKPVLNSSVTLNVEMNTDDKSYYFWSHFFTFANHYGTSMSDTKNRYGYIGLQTGEFKNGAQEQAIFSIWNAIQAKGIDCGPFGGEGVGLQCKLPIKFVSKGFYRLEIKQVAVDFSGEWWEGRLNHINDHTQQVIGRIKTPLSSGAIVSSVLFTEYYYPLSHCSKIPPAQATFINLKNSMESSIPKLNGYFENSPCKQIVKTIFSNQGVHVETGYIQDAL